jgi:S1-C subfamily serine protease
MNALDLMLVLGALLAMLGGYRLGFATRVVSWLGLGLGLLVGVRLLPIVLGRLQGADRFQLVLVAVAVVMTGAALGQAAGLAISSRISPGRRQGTAAKVDRTLGAVAGLVGIAALAWLLFPLMATTPGWLSDATAHSSIARAFAEHLPTAPDASQVARSLIGPSQFPEVIDELAPPSESVSPPAATGLSPALAASVARSTLKIEGISCQRVVDGSGFVVEPGLVATNAHVVAGERSTTAIRDDGRRFDATVVAYDPERDLALLSVPGLNRPALALADPTVAERGGVFGHPGGAPLRIAPFEIVRQITAVGKDIYGVDSTRRQVLELAASLAPGDSGSALVDVNGEVVGVAFAVSTTRDTTAYALAPSELRAVLAQPRGGGVSTDACAA